MACGVVRQLCTAERIFIFINIAFAMYAGALLATAARLAWDPSTYTWFRFLCAEQYRVSAVYVLAAGLWLAALVYIASVARRTRCLHIYACGVVCLVVSEVAYGAWMAVSLEAWWRSAPQAELARRLMDVLNYIKPTLIAIEQYRNITQPLYDIIEEVEHEAPNNAVVIVIFGAFGIVLQIAAFVMARRLAVRAGRGARAAGAARASETEDEKPCGSCAPEEDSDSDTRPPPGCRKNANLRMYTILDKIF